MTTGALIGAGLVLPAILFADPQALSTRAGLDARGVALIDFSLGTYESPGCYVDMYTVARGALDAQPEWDGSGPLPTPLETLVRRAQTIAREVRPSLAFETIRIAPCYDAPAKKYAVVTFTDSLASHHDLFERDVFLLLDGTRVDKARIDITNEQYHQIWERGIDARDDE
ncbi:MAG: hypothetical protein MUE60_15210 [Candidatus Eisenbacteria bacterium]|jgi:hypothetical protein|nr:hypothetical protein [Candidatus Eisenbacteria bacterium]